MRERLIQLLRRTFDSKRLIQKLSLGRGDADDLIALCRTIRITLEIAASLESDQQAKGAGLDERSRPALSIQDENHVAERLDDILRRFALDGPGALADRIADAIDEEGVTQMHRYEELEAAVVVAMAHSVEDQQVSGSEGGLGQKKKGQSKNQAKINTAKSQGMDSQDVWVMKKRYSTGTRTA